MCPGLTHPDVPWHPGKYATPNEVAGEASDSLLLSDQRRAANVQPNGGVQLGRSQKRIDFPAPVGLYVAVVGGMERLPSADSVGPAHELLRRGRQSSGLQTMEYLDRAAEPELEEDTMSLDELDELRGGSLISRNDSTNFLARRSSAVQGEDVTEFSGLLKRKSSRSAFVWPQRLHPSLEYVDPLGTENISREEELASHHHLLQQQELQKGDGQEEVAGASVRCGWLGNCCHRVCADARFHCGFFRSDCGLALACRRWCTGALWFDTLVLVLVVSAVAVLLLRLTWTWPLVWWLDAGVGVLFLLELLIRAVAFGFLWKRGAYCRRIWTCVQGVVVVVCPFLCFAASLHER